MSFIVLFSCLDALRKERKELSNGIPEITKQSPAVRNENAG